VRTVASANFVLVGPQERASFVREQTPPISASGAKRRSSRIAHTAPMLVTWVDSQAGTIAEETTTVSINCHGFQYFSKQRPKKNSPVTFQLVINAEDRARSAKVYLGRVAWVRKSLRLDGLYVAGIEFTVPLNIWNLDDAPEDWAAFSPTPKEDPASFLGEVDRILNSASRTSHYQLLNVESSTPRSEVKKHYYQMARRFHPDHHMDHPEWTPRLLELMENLTEAYETLSDDETKEEYDALLAQTVENIPSDARKLAQGYLEKAQECIVERNIAGSILWLHHAIEAEPNSSSHRAMLGRCLSTIPEYCREAVEQFEMAIDLDPRNLAAHLDYGELLESLKVPWRARFHYLRALEIDPNHKGARERLNRLGAGMPRTSSKSSLLGRLTGRR